jgi:glycosyltransferase involved in cell wall biosynthesis
MHPYVHKDETPALLAEAGAALITLDDDALGLMSPSKLHSALASGLPVLYIGPAGSNVDEAIRRFGCGVSLRHGDVDGLVDAIRTLQAGGPVAEGLRASARRAFEQAYSDAATLPRFDQVLAGTAGREVGGPGDAS